jgi:hypothetical protein
MLSKPKDFPYVVRLNSWLWFANLLYGMRGKGVGVGGGIPPDSQFLPKIKGT